MLWLAVGVGWVEVGGVPDVGKIKASGVVGGLDDGLLGGERRLAIGGRGVEAGAGDPVG